jgi:PHD/YefM family antitoxin component YafN of YafNO toxin-antitoxin module
MEIGMAAVIRDIATLPKHHSTEVKNHWGNVAREVKRFGEVAITRRDNVELVLMSADRYRLLTEQLGTLPMEDPLARLEARFDLMLKTLQDPDAASQLDQAFGDIDRATLPIAGQAF